VTAYDRALEEVDLALDAAAMLIQSNAGTNVAARMFQCVLQGLGRPGFAIAPRLDLLTAVGRVEGRPVTVARPVGAVGTNLLRVSEGARIGERLARGKADRTMLRAEMDRLQRLPVTYPRWIVVLASGAAAACFTRIAGGDWGAFCIALVAAVVGQAVRLGLVERNALFGIVTFVAGLAAAVVAAAGLKLGLSRTAPAAVIASIVFLVPGLMLINGFMDVVSGRYLPIGLERLANALYLFLLLTLAIAIARAVMGV
jgi:uncharacterized membrane protein YjjP (DUF1212 family)